MSHNQLKLVSNFFNNGPSVNKREFSAFVIDFLSSEVIIGTTNGTLIDDAWLFVEIMNQELKDRRLPQIDITDYRKHFIILNLYIYFTTISIKEFYSVIK